MKKIITLVSTALLLTAGSVTAFWDSTNNWNDGDYSDNGIFDYNPYNYGEPRWFTKEMANLFNEFDSGLNTSNNVKYNTHSFPAFAQIKRDECEND
jgi:hypothetical protein